MTFHELKLNVRQTIAQAGWPLPFRIGMSEWTEKDGKLTVKSVPGKTVKELLSPSLQFARLDCARGGEPIRERRAADFSFATEGWVPGVHRLFAIAKLGEESLVAEVPVLILEKDAYWKEFADNLTSKFKKTPRSQSLHEFHERLNDVKKSWLAHWLPDLGIKTEVALGRELSDPKHNVLKEPVNMWTVYQVIRLLYQQAYEQLFWGGQLVIKIEEEERRLKISARFESVRELSSHHLFMLQQSAHKLPDLEALIARIEPPSKLHVVAKFPVYYEAGGGAARGPAVKVTDPGGGEIKLPEGEFDLRCMKVPA